MCQGAAWVHAAATPHVTCVEHGESVHLALRAGHSPVQRAATLDVLGAPADATAHGHEHCGLQGQGSTSAPTPHRTAVDVPVLSTPTPSAAPARAPAALLRLAPKTSPPRPPAV
jgi:hypothetical protein